MVICHPSLPSSSTFALQCLCSPKLMLHFFLHMLYPIPQPVFFFVPSQLVSSPLEPRTYGCVLQALQQPLLITLAILRQHIVTSTANLGVAQPLQLTILVIAILNSAVTIPIQPFGLGNISRRGSSLGITIPFLFHSIFILLSRI